MAKVILKNSWFAPDGQFYHAAAHFAVELPDRLVPFLPKSARVVKDGEQLIQPTAKVAPMMNIDTRGGGVSRVTSEDVFPTAPAALAVDAVSRDATSDVAQVPPEVAVQVAAVEAVTKVEEPAKKPGRRS